MADIFISYKAEEFNEASWVKQTLENNGISCWMAPSSIPGGSNYAVEIPKAIRECKILVLILSEKAQESKWVPRELDQAINENKIIMPFALDNCSLKDDFNFYLSNVQRYAAFENKSAAIEKMLKEIRAIIGTNGNGEKASVPVGGTYVAPPAPAPKKQTTDKSKLKLIGIIGAVLAIILIILIIVLPKGGKKSDDPPVTPQTDKDPEQTNPQDNQEPQKEDPEIITMSDELFDFTFKLEGVVYKLPVKYEVLTQNGWTISSNGYTSDTKIAGNKYECYNMSKDGRSIYVYSYNYGGDARAIKDCLIGGVECYANKGADFSIAKGITPQSTAEEIKTAFGIPGYSNSGDDYESLTYYAQKDSSYNSVKFYCNSDSKYSSVTLMNFIETDDYKTVTNTEKPGYLSEYKKPSAMGTDLKSAVVKIDGVLYQLPAPVSEFTGNGWTITQQSGDVVAGGTDSIRVEKDGQKLDLYIINYAEYQTLVENCAVYKVYVSDYDKADIVIGSEAKPVFVGADKNAVDTAKTDDIDFSDGTYSYTYSFYEYKDRDFSLSIYVDKETGKVSTVSVSCKTWAY